MRGNWIRINWFSALIEHTLKTHTYWIVSFFHSLICHDKIKRIIEIDIKTSRHNYTSKMYDTVEISPQVGPLAHDQTKQLMSRFPPFELSYETVCHKKVSNQYNVCFAIPQGRKYYIWFTFLGDKNVCLLLDIGRDKKIGKVVTVTTTFLPALSLGTILYGTVLTDESEPFTPETKRAMFVVEDALWYKGLPLSKSIFGEKLGYLYEMFSKGEVSRACSVQTVDLQMSFVLPVGWSTETTETEFEPTAIVPEKWKSKVSYMIHHFQYRSLSKLVPFMNVLNNRISTKPVLLPASNSSSSYVSPVSSYRPDFKRPQYKMASIFQVRADIQFDIYHLYAYGQSGPAYYDIAYIPNYKSSVFMNGLFRNIKENKNLDYIEESDDEDDFENCKEDKYVDLKKIVYMECVFNIKFKRWTPVKVVNTNRMVQIHKL